MARILAISSQVVSGHVGLSAMVPALQRLGHEVLPLPTVLLSNHPGQQAAAGTRIDPGVLIRILEALEANGRLLGIDAVLTGYLPDAAHVAVSHEAIRRVMALNPSALIACDPVIGDDPKGVYIDGAAAVAIRDTLVGSAGLITPNRFELSWLAGNPVTDAASATSAARSLGLPLVVATSIPMTGDRLATLAITTDRVVEASVPRRHTVPNGTGDLLAALFVSEYLANRTDPAAALQTAVGWVDRVLDASDGRRELDLSADWRSARPDRSADLRGEPL